jgi:hydrogenase maturation protease
MKDSRTKTKRILLIAVGNSGRGDDGLGWAFADKAKNYTSDSLDYEYCYQLQIEDAEQISKYDTVIFVDASHSILDNGFEMKICEATNHYFFSSHVQSPETVLYLSNDLYRKKPEAYTMAIQGSDWDLKTSLSKEAKKNLHRALDFFVKEYLPTIYPGKKETINQISF